MATLQILKEQASGERDEVDPKTAKAISMVRSELNSKSIIDAKTLGAAVFPLVEYIHDVEPEYIIACDRGARLIGFAVFELYTRLHGRLPTVDGTLRFARISSTNYESETTDHLRPMVEEILKKSGSEAPKVLLLDDWTGSGYTREIATSALKSLSSYKIDVKFGVLIGDNKSTDVNGIEDACDVAWMDNELVIGVDYKYKDFNPVVVGSQKSHDFRAEVVRNIDALVNAKRQGSEETRSILMEKGK